LYTVRFIVYKANFLYNIPMKIIKSLLLNFTVILLASFVLTCVSVPIADFVQLGKGTDKVPLTGRAITGTLPNGLRYFIIENRMPENRAHLALVVNAGSVLEKDDERGLAHFVEHLAFKGTSRFPETELIEYLRSLGMRFGADANAYTSYNETVYYFDVPVENRQGVKTIPERALAILDDWTYAVKFNPEDIKNEGLVVLEELRSRLGAMERVRKITLPILFAGSAYANREPIGLQEIIENAADHKVKGFYGRWYTSDNMALVFAGDFDGKALEASLARNFNMPSAVKPVNRPKYELPPPKNGNFQVEVITDPELTSASFMIYYKQKQGAQKGTLGYYRETIIDYLIDTMLSMRFEEASDNPDSSATGAWGGIWPWAENSRFYTMGTDPKTGNAENALRELLLEKEAMRRYGFTQSELERAKLNLVSYMEKQLSEKDRRDSRSYIRGFTSHFLYGEDMADVEWEMNAVSAMLPGIGLKEIQKAVKNYFSHNDCTVFLIAPSAEAGTLPSKERIKAVFAETEKAVITPRQSELLTNELLDSVPPKGSVTNEVTDRETGAVTITLSNGVKVILKETQNKNNEIVLYAMARGGTLNASESEYVSADFASEMLSASGLGPYSRIELVNRLAGKQVSNSFWTGSYYRGFQGASTKKDIKTLFEMIYMFFTKSNLDEKAVAAMIDQYKTSLKHQEDDPEKYFSRELSKIINSKHPRFKPLELADMDKISTEKAFAFINRCINPADYTFVFTGNLNVNEMKELCAGFIASIPNAPSMNTWVDHGITRPARLDKKLYKGKDERCTVYLGWFAPAPSAFDEGRNQTAAVLSEYLDIILTDEIREKMSGVYSISAGASVSTIPKGEYRLSIYFQCSPARVDELIAAVQERITEIYTKPLNQDTVNKSKEALLKEHENSMQRNLHIAQSFANSSVLYNTPLNRLNTRPQAIRAVRPENVQSLCKDMTSSGPVQVVLFPEGR
jgi:zinc protease